MAIVPAAQPVGIMAGEWIIWRKPTKIVPLGRRRLLVSTSVSCTLLAPVKPNLGK
jgi:hypothetical protein